MGYLIMVLLDTCAVLWWTLDPGGLSDAAAATCSRIASKGAFISSITIWEIGIKIKKGTLNIGEDLEDYVGRLKRLGSVEMIPVDEDIWIKNLSLDWPHRDPVDRTVVATAMLRKIPIVTKDRLIKDFYPEVIW